MEILERESFLAALGDYAADASAGSGRLVVVTGEAGIGKTTLIDTFRATRPDLRWLWGACDGGFTPRPLGPLYDVATGAGGHLRDLLSGESDRNQLFAAFLDLLGDGVPTGVVIEDLHWADEATLDWLSHVSRRLSQLPAMFLITVRDDEPGDTGPLAELMGRLATHRSTRRMALPRLSSEAVGSLTGARDGRELHALTGGNPFLVGEVLAMPGADVPPSVADVVRARLRRHSPSAQRILAGAAVLGRPAPASLLAAVAGVPVSAVDECRAAGTLVAGGPDFAFRHELTRRAVEDALPHLQRTELHRIALLALERDGANVTELTHHAVGAADVAAVLRYAPRAGRAAADASAHREAVIHFQRALTYADQMTAAVHAELEEALTESLFVRDQWADAEEHWRRTIELRRPLGDPVPLSRCLRRYGLCLRRLCRTKESLAAEAESYELMRAADDCAERAIVFWVRGMSDHLAPVDRRSAIDECARIGRDLGDDRLVGMALQARALVRNVSGVVDFELLEEALVHGKRSGDAWLTASAYANIHWAKVDQLRFDLLPDTYPEGLTYCLDHEQHAYGLYLQGSHVMELVRRGGNDQAVDLAVESLGETISPVIRLHVMIGLVRAGFRLGRPEARSWLEDAWRLGLSTDETSWMVRIATCAAEGSWLTDDPALVDDRVHEAYRRGLVEDPWLHGDLSVWLGRVGDPLDPDRSVPSPYSLELASLYAEAADAWREIGCPFEEAVARACTGDHEQLRRAHEIFTRLGTAPAAAKVRRLLQQQGIKAPAQRGPRASTAAHPAGLTAREAEVLGVLREGLTNAEIARRLYLSPRTVDHHVSSILAKLGVSTRAEAARHRTASTT